jgi:hypothetical protein
MHIFPGNFRDQARPKEVQLNNIRIASPCPADWEKMVGDDWKRHCAECNLNVYNLSAMTERQVQELIAATGSKRLCVRFYRRADGTVVTQDCPWSLRAMTRKVSRIAATVLTAIMGVSVALARNKPQPAICECSHTQQEYSGIKLTVVDQHGAVIAKAEIILERKSGKATTVGVTGPAGEWGLLKLDAGRYEVTVKSQGFSTFSSVVDVQDGRLLSLKVKLPVATMNTTVEVTAGSPVIMGTTVGILTETHQSLFLPVPAARQQRSPMQP